VFDPDSRYANQPTARHRTSDGREIVYVESRFIPPASGLSPVARVRTIEHERLDQIAARSIGDPFQYWLVCDANEAMNPEELVQEPGRILTIAIPD